MVLKVDTSAPLLRPSQLCALVRAVHDAADHDEHRWIEWKSGLGLTSSAGQGHLAKAVIGLANRQPAAAARWAGGYGYLLVGVEPGGLGGVTPVDPETLVGQLRSAVGDVLRWTPEYVTVDGVEVLVVVVDPPRPGDPIHCLRKQVDRFQAGTVFVRHTGRTDPATPADLDMLQARLLDRVPGLQLAVAATPPSIETSPDIPGSVRQWIERRRPVVLAARHRPTPQRMASRDDLVPSFRNLSASFVTDVNPDKRTEEEYTRQVDKFLDKAEWAFTQRAVWDLYRHMAALLHIQVTNPTDLGYTAVRLVVHIPGDVSCYPDEFLKIADVARAPFPSPPTPLGTPTVMDNPLLSRLASDYLPYARNVVLPNIGRDFCPGPAYTVTDTGSVDIQYREFDVRPGDTYALEPVPVLVREGLGVTLTATWYATAADVRGRLNGEFELAVTESTLDMSSIDREADDDDNA